MARRLLLLASLAWAGLAAAASPPAAPEANPAPGAPPDPATAVLQRYFEVTGGPAGLAQVGLIACRAEVEAFGYAYGLQLDREGRFRIEEPDRITGCDGGEIWQSFHGLVGPATAAGFIDYTRSGLHEVFFFGLLDRSGRPATLEYAGIEERHGRRHERLAAAPTSEGVRRTYFFDAATGLLEKIVELAPDPELHELKNVYRIGAYEAVGPLKLPARVEGHCLTTGQIVLAPVHYTAFEVRPGPTPESFARPAPTAPAAVLEEGRLRGQVLDVSGRGSLITNVTRADLERLGLRQGDGIEAEVKGRTSRHRWLADEQLGAGIESGEYLALFSGTPALWLVKAYVGMTSDQPVSAGDAVILRRAGEEPTHD